MCDSNQNKRSFDEKHKIKSQKHKEKVDASIQKAQIERGSVLVITGNGKGKSTAGFGVVTRAVGHGYQAAVVQFIKGTWECGERNLLMKHGVPFAVMNTGFTWDTQDHAADTVAAKKVWKQAEVFLRDPNYHIVLLDELTYMIAYRYLDSEMVINAIKHRPIEQSVIITGRGASKFLKDIADTVSEIKSLKHAFHAGIKARKGLDY
jgi:cob(I)alamin adenosyltransferase